MREKLVTVDNISMEYLGQTLFRDLSFDIYEGDKAVIKGSSGSGKSTILNMLCCFENPLAGSITALNLDLITHAEEVRKYFSWLPQDLNFPDEDTVLNVIKFPFSFKSNSHLQVSKEDILSEFDFLNLRREIIDSKYVDLSGGEKQRVGIIISKLLRRKIMLLDEPTSALDRYSLNRVIDYLLKDNSLTIISVSHDDTWCSNCNKIIEINS